MKVQWPLVRGENGRGCSSVSQVLLADVTALTSSVKRAGRQEACSAFASW